MSLVVCCVVLCVMCGGVDCVLCFCRRVCFYVCVYYNNEREAERECVRSWMHDLCLLEGQRINT